MDYHFFLPYVPQKNCNFSQVTLRLRPRSGARGCVSSCISTRAFAWMAMVQMYMYNDMQLYTCAFILVHMIHHMHVWSCVCVWVERLNKRYTSILFLSSAGGGSRVQSLPPTKTPWFPWWYKEPACRLSCLDEFNFCTVFEVGRLFFLFGSYLALRLSTSVQHSTTWAWMIIGHLL